MIKGGMDVKQEMETMIDNTTGQPRVLLMEDESSVANGLRMVLTDGGYDVDLAMTGQSALETLHHKDFDLLWLISGCRTWMGWR